jgi:outer membrane protein assembly factor BamB
MALKVGCQGFLYALNASNGPLLWTFPAAGSGESSPTEAAVTINGTPTALVFVGSGGNDNNGVFVGGEVYAIYANGNGAQSGTALWSFQTGAPVISSPTVAMMPDGTQVVFVGSVDDNLYALDAATGQPYWPHPFKAGCPIVSSPVVPPNVSVNGSPIIYFGSYDDNIYAVYASGANAGQVYWSYTTGNAIYSSPTVEPVTNSQNQKQNVVFIGSDDDKVYAIDADGPNYGQPYGPAPFVTGGFVHSSPTEATLANGDQVVFVGDDDGKLYAINAVTGLSYANWSQPFQRAATSIAGRWLRTAPSTLGRTITTSMPSTPARGPKLAAVLRGMRCMPRPRWPMGCSILARWTTKCTSGRSPVRRPA